MNLNANLTKFVCLALASVAIACHDGKKKVLPVDHTPGVRKRTFESKDYASGWKYFSFKKGDFIAAPAKPEESLEWDVAFNRYYVKTNSGTSGKGKGGCRDSGETEFAAVTADKNAAFVADDSLRIMTTMGSYGMDSYNSAVTCEGSYSWVWYDYKISQWYHNRHVFVIRAASGENCAKMIFDSYKNSKGESGYITFRYVYDGEQAADIDQPEDAGKPAEPIPTAVKRDTVESAYMGGSKWHYYSFKNGLLPHLTDDEAKTSKEWDIAFDRNYIRTNSTLFGSGEGGALEQTGKTKFEEVPICPPSGYTQDKILTIKNSPMSMPKELETSVNPAFECGGEKGAWFVSKGMGKGYEYNRNVFAIMCADGKTKAKLIMCSFGNSQIVFEFVYPAD